MSIVKDFTNEDQARIFRDSQRDKKLAASLFTYGKDRYRVEVWELWATHPEWTQTHLSQKANDLSNDIEDLTKVRELITSPDFGCGIEDVVFVARKLSKNDWFSSPTSVIDFFDGDCTSKDELAKIKDMVNTALKEYDEQWNNKSEVTA